MNQNVNKDSNPLINQLVKNIKTHRPKRKVKCRGERGVTLEKYREIIKRIKDGVYTRKSQEELLEKKIIVNDNQDDDDEDLNDFLQKQYSNMKIICTHQCNE
ncbi:hypothetical protein HCN44_001296 [Aphidius gifuensis]|uniref:Uncharacterized protein n=1 Tax=Aphidius gifuensis TaxID=684658 RepID=A0A834XK61_APHGI|nr:uncharacterized protein LOC122857027 [Aphidius gifuensis]KAF7988723.1 hypothetical protein HCN44_001296 [Aphidius gifuensis]